MKKLTKLLAPSIALFMASLIAITGATYAWFQTSTKGTVADINASVISASGMLMSWSPETANSWVSDLAFDDANYSATGNKNTNFLDASQTSGFKFKPNSTVNIDTSVADYSFYRAKIINDKISQIDKATFKALNETELANGADIGTGEDDYGRNDGIIKFDIYFQVTQETTIALYDSTDSTVQSQVVLNDVRDIGLSSRVAFIYRGATGTAANAKNLNTNKGSFIWEPNATTHTIPGCQDAGVATDSNAVFNYYGLAKEMAKPSADTAYLDRFNKTGTDYSAQTSEYLKKVTTVTDLTSESARMTIEMKDSLNSDAVITTAYAKVTVYVWVEGQDQDCTNALSSTAFTLKLIFDKYVAA